MKDSNESPDRIAREKGKLFLAIRKTIEENKRETGGEERSETTEADIHIGVKGEEKGEIIF